MKALLKRISKCNECAAHLPLGTNPILTAHPKSKLIIIGQAPGLIVHKSSIPWDDKSGNTLREWLQLPKTDFYNPEKVALLPMGFCYPGKGKSGDLPPRKECAPQWHDKVLKLIENAELIVLIGKYAQDYYLGKRAKRTLTETVRNFEDYLPEYLVLPHPSPRNNIWKAKNQWFEKEIIPVIQHIVKNLQLSE